jgi:hypothetical protein
MTRRPSIEVFMPLHFAEVNKATSRMSELEECAYLRLIRDYWLNGAPPNDDATLARTVRYPLARWRKVRGAVLGQFELVDGRWMHPFTEAKREHALGVSATRRLVREGGSDGCTIVGTIADIRDVQCPVSVSNNLSNQGLAEELKVGTGAEVIPLVGRTVR